MHPHNRFVRVLTLAAMSVSSVILAGGALVTTASPSSAATGGTDVCSSAVGTSNYFTGVATETLSGCHQQGSAVVDELRPQGPLGPVQITIHWATGHATSHVTTGPSVYKQGAPCPAGDVWELGTLIVIDGPYAGSTVHNAICDDLSRFPIVTWTNLGPLEI
jgi:hypothetical protein